MTISWQPERGHTSQMKIQAPRRPNPFDSPLLRILLHGFASCVILGSIYFAITTQQWVPVIVGFGVITILESVWIYFLIRR
jgi:hypothetical protein